MLQTLNLESMSEQTEVYHLMHYIADLEDEIIACASEKSAFYDYFININYAELE